MKGYMLIIYDDLKSFQRNLGNREEICRSNQGALFEKLWFMANVQGTVMVHEYMAKAPELNAFVKELGLKEINATYEWVR